MVLPCQKQFFEIPDDVTYLNCSYLSPMFESIKKAGIEGVMRKERPWEIKPKDFFEQSTQLKQLFAKIVNAATNDIAIIPSVSYGIGIAVNNICMNPKENIVVLEEQFPSNIYPWRSRDANIITVERPQNHDWTQSVLQAIDDDTTAVSVPQCHWTDGSFVDVEKIGGVCRKKNIPLVIDATQSLGIFDFDVQKIRPAFVVAAGYKWLLGPYSLGFMYVHPDYQRSLPLEHNWLSRKGSENFSQLVNYTDEYAPGACRFDVGERNNFVLLPMAMAALQQILDWGVENIYRSVVSLVDTIIERIHDGNLTEKHDFEIIPQSFRCGHILGLRFRKSLPEGFGNKMSEQNVFVSIRSNVIRVSPYIYNSISDCEKFVQILDEVLEVQNA
ncbi:aminotransferase class V-fold PLP-dependent enzyme [Candidatus Uabimicrobium amorphum]|uniref:Aminotransferase n=2 Tax=Uabimicrobium amorphum TaxID=2596890 RepID=A0A5S9IL23_UABAM|nr:aminotransferase [Candidatus Uabimicrobium amorphum]